MLNESINKLNQSELEGSNTPCLPKPPSIISILNTKLSPNSNTPFIAVMACDHLLPGMSMGVIRMVIRLGGNQ